LGQQDVYDRLLIPERLYGREAETQALLAAFDLRRRPRCHGDVLVSGYAGIGKSSLVNELHKALVPTRGLFAAGKFDQYTAKHPLCHAGSGLPEPGPSDPGEIRLGDERVAVGPCWRPSARTAKLMVNCIPELALVIGDQPPVTDLPPQDRQNRFQLVFRRFLGVFARAEIRWRCSSTICNGWIPRPSILSNISSPIPRCAICC